MMTVLPVIDQRFKSHARRYRRCERHPPSTALSMVMFVACRGTLPPCSFHRIAWHGACTAVTT
jgi:hypothetical protein